MWHRLTSACLPVGLRAVGSTPLALVELKQGRSDGGLLDIDDVDGPNAHNDGDNDDDDDNAKRQRTVSL